MALKFIHVNFIDGIEIYPC